MGSTYVPTAGVEVPAVVRQKLIEYLVSREAVTAELADRIVTATAVFLAVSATHPGRRLVPSVLIDKGWHAFLMYPAAYTAFCAQLGRLVDHVPDTGPQNMGTARADVSRTRDLIRTNGHPIDGDLWAVAADCSQCHAGCSDSP
ncbi:hypothetical protein LO772_14545 [Yinghuangia sp. ASG 101]|uniref:glycine-rich domain-containing protein n=1 Tax=Yinghuangia sp. ASG 101 TaxID=2896848 RepID=UPI001E58F0A4|nr:hypothetical protein [Yinghuangia sp. ASG 101]UGQ14688.1 hypothetical protein LO772_14545 [Yinghuangia sp. ASG 101]